MKQFLLSAVFYIFFISLCSAQSSDSTRKSSDSASKDSLSKNPVLSKEIVFVKGAIPTISKGSMQLQRIGGTRGAVRNTNKVVAPGDPGEPGYPPIDPVDPTDPVDPVDPGNPPSGGVTLDAGRTAGKLDVSATGGAIYTVPVSLPPGLGGFVPQVALSYNSQGGKGVVGLGWEILGRSAITMISTTRFHDDRIDGVNFNAYDRFALDGQRLVLKSGIYGTDGAEYQTENYSNIRIISHGVSPFGNNIGPEYFEVLYPDGSKAFYGNSSSSRSPSEYAITYKENATGARISYQYINSNNTLLLSQIDYGGMGTAQAINQIIFNYGYAYRAEHGYIAGTAFYQASLLQKITVVANGNNFRNYKLTYNTVPTLNYQRLSNIQEFDGTELKALTPIYFTYGATNDVMSISVIGNLSLSGIASNNSDIVTADFTGNGSMDFLLYPKYSKDKFWAFFDVEAGSPYYQLGYQVNVGYFTDIFPANWLTWNNKIIAGQGMLVVKGALDIPKFEMYSSGTTSPVYYQYEKTWTDFPRGPSYYSECDGMTHDGAKLGMTYVSGDFNGDGLTDLMAVNDAQTVVGERYVYYQDPVDDRASYWACEPDYGEVTSSAYFIDMDRRLTSNYITSLGSLADTYHYYEKLLTGDFNGDGRADILHVKSGWMGVYSMNSSNSLELLWSLPDSRISYSQQILIGDYNGDGKLDVMFTTGNNSYFATFLSTGKSFIKHEQYQPFSNTAGTWNGAPPGTLNLYYLMPSDVDGDGKTDIISAQTTTYNNSSNGTIYATVYYNSGASSNGQPNFTYGQSSNWRQANLKHYPIPVLLNTTRLNYKLEFGFMSDNSVSLFKFEKDFKKESQLTSVDHDGITHTIAYRSLDNSQDYSSDIQLYQSGYEQTYPYVDLQSIPGLNVVSKLSRYYNGQQLNQVYGYGKAVSHAGGLGFLGFGELIRSNWYIDSYDNNRIFNIDVFDPLLRGAPVRSFTSKSSYINPAIKDYVISALPSSAVSDGASLNDYITRSDKVYSTQLQANKIFINVPVASASKNMLSGTYYTEALEYDTYFNPVKITDNINGAGTKITEISYANNPSGYFIGRPLTNKVTLSNGSDVFSTEEEYTYSGALPIQIRRKGNNTGWMTENMGYDAFGNVSQKTVTSPDGAQRSGSMIYDATGRFLVQSTDAEGMIASKFYDNSTGNILSSTNPFGQTESNQYDSWGRLVLMTDYLGKSSHKAYDRALLGGITISSSNDEGRSSVKFIDAFGRDKGGYEKTVLGGDVANAVEYDVYGRLYRQSKLAPLGSASQWNYTTYDEYGRTKQTVSFTGKVSNYAYSGLTTTINDGTKSVSTTRNAFGKVQSLQDPGGTINYTYFANDNLKTADYMGVVLTVEQDGWGRRKKLVDPSAGEYQYQYDGWGQMIKEINPKGFTEYEYDAVGKVTKKKLVGDETNMVYFYTYDSNSKLLTNLSLTNSDGNNTNYTYQYDSNHRLSSTTEDNLQANFVKGYTYDGFGRISTESYSATNKANNLTAQKTVEIQYQNGEPLQTSLQGTGQILWKLTNLDGGGAVTEAIQGGAIKKTFQYDTYGFPQQDKTENVSSTPVTLMNLGYSFDAQQGLLSNRSNSAFNWSESFSYDSQNRMTNFNDNNGNNTQSYDNKGRILNNSQLGDYSYDSGSYKQTELDLSNNATANAYYQQDHALQQVTYNIFKSPVEIFEQGKERIGFEYNGALSRSHMYYGDEHTDKTLRRYRKHYSEDGGMEITHDNQTGKTSFVFYLGGDAYNAPAIWKEVHEGTQSSQNLYFLHRDHIGSIVMITDDQGGIVEKRVFDAWGNIIKLQDGYGNNLAGFIILDRGFSGHEHLLGVGLIHMNGRLYDPKLHRFLSPDNFVQDPYNTQNYNRYGYAMNNPLMFVDPSGEFLFFAFLAPIVGKIAAAIIGGGDSWGSRRFCNLYYCQSCHREFFLGRPWEIRTDRSSFWRDIGWPEFDWQCRRCGRKRKQLLAVINMGAFKDNNFTGSYRYYIWK